MQLQLKPCQKLTQKLSLTPQMRLAIHLLQMPLVKLKEFIKAEAEVNPLLDIGNGREFEEENYNFADEAKQNYQESLITASATLQEHLLRQLQLIVNFEEERKIGELIIGNLDDNGYLRCSLEEIAESAKTELSKAEEVLFIVQTFDPVGVGARDLRECLLLQLKAKGEENSLPGQIVDKYLSYLEKKRYSYIAKKLSAESAVGGEGGSASGRKVSAEDIKEALETIASLEPKPGRSFSTERAIRLIPDAILNRNPQGYEVIFSDWELPQLTINDKYRQMIRREDTPQEAKEYLRERVKAVHSLINGIKKRQETIQEIIEEIVSVQKDFLDSGEFNFKPLTLDYIAKKIGKHKSTVSRAIANKYLETPWGILELRYFFGSGVRQENGALLSSKAVKSKIKDLIENESKEKPLIDREIADYLKQEGISVSRRTIAKYRQQLKILPSQLRQE
jgi:RNA polymerase sigma-54 factor